MTLVAAWGSSLFTIKKPIDISKPIITMVHRLRAKNLIFARFLDDWFLRATFLLFKNCLKV
jgi:hypothetical protein